MNTLVHAASSSYDLYLEQNPSILTRNIYFWIPFSHRTIKTIMHVSLYPEQPIYCRLPLLRINLAEVMLLDIYLLRIKNIELKYGRLVFSLSFSSSLALPTTFSLLQRAFLFSSSASRSSYPCSSTSPPFLLPFSSSHTLPNVLTHPLHGEKKSQ